MNLQEGILSPIWWGSAWAILAVVLIAALWTAPWYKVRKDRAAQHVFLGACVFLAALWSLKAGLEGGIAFHLLGMTFITLMFGFQFALIAAILATLVITVNGSAGWDVFALNVLLMGAVPAAITAVFQMLWTRIAPKHFFVYILVNGFLTAAIVSMCTILLIVTLLAVSGTYDWYIIQRDYLILLPLLMFPEAFLNGFILTFLVINKPHWLATFSDEEYLKGK